MKGAWRHGDLARHGAANAPASRRRREQNVAALARGAAMVAAGQRNENISNIEENERKKIMASNK